jgi:hypothetical protein
MTSLIPNPHFIQDATHICMWFLLIGFAIATHTAQAEEGKFATEKNTLTNRVMSSDIRRPLPYQSNTNIALNGQNNALLAGAGSGGTPRLSFFNEPEEEDSWSVNIQKQAPSSSKCSPSSLTCFDSNDDRTSEIKPQQDSFWFVLRKAFHF